MVSFLDHACKRIGSAFLTLCSKFTLKMNKTVLEMFKFFIERTETFSRFAIVTVHIWTKLFQLTQVREKVNTVHPVNTRKSVQNVAKKENKHE